MSTTETSIVTGTWSLDTVHSIVGFEVDYMVGTFKGRFHDVTATLSVGEDGRAILEGTAKVAERRRPEPGPDRAPAEPRLLRRRAVPRAPLHGGGHQPRRRPDHGRRRDHDQGRHEARDRHRHGHAPDRRPVGHAAPRASTVAATVDRTDFGLNWNNPLPTGDLALANEVTIVAELQFVQSA